MERQLTARQQQVYDFIHDKISLRGYGPTVREIGEYLGIKSPNGVMCHLRALERKGMINRIANKSRAIELVNRIIRDKTSSLTVHGQVDHGECNLFDAPKSIDVLGLLEQPDRYLLRYNGNELQDWAIADGDILVIQHSSHGSVGSLALVRSREGGIALKPSPDQCQEFDEPASKSVGIAIVKPQAKEPTLVETNCPVEDGASNLAVASWSKAATARAAPVTHVENQGAEVIGVVVGVVRAQQCSRIPFTRTSCLQPMRQAQLES